MNASYDIVVIGAGSAGLTGARFAARLGARVALVERARVGGDCTWTGCVPSKSLIRAAAVAEEVRTAGAYGIDAPPPLADMRRVRGHVAGAIRSVYEAERPDALEAEGIDVVLGPARFTDPRTLLVGGRALTARRFVVCTGARAVVPPIPGLSESPYVTHESVFDVERLPEHLLVIGAGPIGLELAQAYRRLGADVTVMAADLLPREEADVRTFVDDRLARDGVRVRLGRVESVSTRSGAITVRGQAGEATGDMLLVAVGRRPDVEELGLAAAGVAHSAQGVTVDRYLRTSAAHVYAAGDALGGPQFTHLAGWQGFQAVRNALLPGRAVGLPRVLPRVTFLDPEVATAGESEAAARARLGERLRVHRIDMSASDRAVAEGRTEGFIKVVTDHRGRILGAAIVADRAGEMIGELVLAIERDLRLSDVAAVVHAYPTWSSAVQQLAAKEAVDGFLAGRVGRLALRLVRLRGPRASP